MILRQKIGVMKCVIGKEGENKRSEVIESQPQESGEVLLKKRVK